MTFPEILQAIDTLTDEQFKQKIVSREAQKTDLAGFEALSDEALWAIVNDTPSETARLDELRQLRESRSLTSDEEAEVSQLLHQHREFILKRSKAIAVLHLRGIDVLGELSEHDGIHS